MRGTIGAEMPTLAEPKSRMIARPTKRHQSIASLLEDSGGAKMFKRLLCLSALCASVAGTAFANDVDAEAAAAANGEYYSEAKLVTCSSAFTCVVAHAKVPKGKTLSVTHASCGVGHSSTLIALSLTRNTAKDIPSGASGTPLLVLEKPLSGSLSDGSVIISGYNQDVSYKIKSELFPIMYAQQQFSGFMSLGCILTGKLN